MLRINKEGNERLCSFRRPARAKFPNFIGPPLQIRFAGTRDIPAIDFQVVAQFLLGSLHESEATIFGCGIAHTEFENGSAALTA